MVGRCHSHALMSINALFAFLISTLAVILLQKVALAVECRVALAVTLSGLHLLYLVEHGYS